MFLIMTCDSNRPNKVLSTHVTKNMHAFQSKVTAALSEQLNILISKNDADSYNLCINGSITAGNDGHIFAYLDLTELCTIHKQ